eukprot:22798_1
MIYWIKKYIGKYHTLNANIITHTGYDEENSTSFFTKIVSNGHHHWRIKIKNKSGNGGMILFGIRKTKSGNPPTDKWFTLNHNGYAYGINEGETASQTEVGSDKEYGVSCKVNDIIEMHLNMNEL